MIFLCCLNCVAKLHKSLFVRKKKRTKYRYFRKKVSYLQYELDRAGYNTGFIGERVYRGSCGDMISGIIHNNLRLENRENVVEQSIIVVEMISELLSSLSTLFKVDFYYVVGNHERISQNKNDSLDKENFGYFILEMIKYRCANLSGLTIHKNNIDDEIITFNIFNNKIVATHGNNFGNLNTYIPKLTSMLGYVPDYVCVGHLHQHVENTYGKTELIINPSLSGTDSYAKNYGLVGKVGQKFMPNPNPTTEYCNRYLDVFLLNLGCACPHSKANARPRNKATGGVTQAE